MFQQSSRHGNDCSSISDTDRAALDNCRDGRETGGVAIFVTGLFRRQHMRRQHHLAPPRPYGCTLHQPEISAVGFLVPNQFNSENTLLQSIFFQRTSFMQAHRRLCILSTSFKGTTSVIVLTYASWRSCIHQSSPHAS